MSGEKIIIDGDGAILGRLASIVAKKLLEGNEVIVYNTEKIIVTGSKERIMERFGGKRDKGDPNKGPFYPIRPDRIFHRVVRGMLPRKKYTGREALKRLKVYIGNPENLSGKKIGKRVEHIQTRYMLLYDISKLLGWKG